MAPLEPQEKGFALADWQLEELRGLRNQVPAGCCI